MGCGPSKKHMGTDPESLARRRKKRARDAALGRGKRKASRRPK